MNTKWLNVKLGEIITPIERSEEPIPGKIYRQIGVKLWGQGSYEREPIDGSQTKYGKLFETEADDIILNKIWARNGSVAVVPNALAGCYGSSEFPMFTTKQNKLVPKWFHWLTKTRWFWDQCDEKSRGTSGKNRIRPERFLEIKIPLPPIEEQRRIVARIEELAAQINEARTLRQQAVKTADSLLASKIIGLFSHRLGKDWTQGKLGDYVLDDCYGTSEKTSDDETGIPILRMGNIQNGQLDLRDLKYLHIPEKDRSKLLLQHGDILVNRTNSAELVGKCAVFELDGNYSFASYLIRLRLDQEKAVPKLVAYYINSPLGRAYMISERRQMTGQANVNSKKLKALPIQLPPLSEQKLIVDELRLLQAEADELKCVQDATTTELDVILPSILARAFKGDL